MERRMDNWNDARLDELNRRVNDGFTEMKDGFAAIAAKGATKEDLAGVKSEVGEVKGELRHLNDKFDRLLHALMVGGISFGVTVFATLCGLVVTQT